MVSPRSSGCTQARWNCEAKRFGSESRAIIGAHAPNGDAQAREYATLVRRNAAAEPLRLLGFLGEPDTRVVINGHEQSGLTCRSRRRVAQPGFALARVRPRPFMHGWVRRCRAGRPLQDGSSAR